MKAAVTLCRVIIGKQSWSSNYPHFATQIRQRWATRSSVTGCSINCAGIHAAGQIRGNGTRGLATSTPYTSTIYALSTAPGKSAIAVIRISGPACLEIYGSLCPGKKPPQPRRAIVRTLFEPRSAATSDNVLDSSALILYFPAPKTVTGEEILELHVHGGPAIVKAVLSAISKCESLSTGKVRYAEPGEFTRRAFMNDRLDLTQVEALGDTLAAATEQQRRLSVRGTTSKLSKSYEAWRQDLLYARGELEALIDFSEDQHFDESSSELCASVALQVHSLQSKLKVHSQNAVRGEMLRHGISIALLGAPNAGKSSLLNRIVGREAAIVSQEAGTTRDVVEVALDIGGYLCRIGDTAGLRKIRAELQTRTPNEFVQQQISQVEEEGMRRAKQRAAESDVVIIVLSLELSGPSGNHVIGLNLDSEVIATARHLVREKGNVLVVVNKVDLLVTDIQSRPSRPPLVKRGAHVSVLTEGFNDADATAGFAEQIMHHIPGLLPSHIHMMTCRDATPDPSIGRTNLTAQIPTGSQGAGVEAFLHGLIAEFRRMTIALSPTMIRGKQHDLSDGSSDPNASVWQESLGASERHRILLDQCCDALGQFLAEVGPAEQDGSAESAIEADIVVAAEHLRTAAECLAKITGRGEGGDVEEVLGVVFEKFCVGK